MTCFACEQEPTQQCPRCGRPFCDDHGEDVCDACLEPASGLPSFTLYRGSLLALLIGTALAVWLILQPPGDNTDAALGPLILTPTTPSEALSPTPGGGGQVPEQPDETPATAQTVEAEGTPEPTEEAPAGTYTVATGDTLSAICETQGPASLTVAECVDQVVSLNGLASANDISVGQDLTMPQ